MSPLPTRFPRTALNAALDLLIPLLLTAADGNLAAAFEEALAMLDDYHPATREELLLASEVISYRLRALGVIRDSSAPDMPQAVVLDMLKTANALRRNQSGAQRKLDALQRARRKAEVDADTPPAPEASLVKPQPAPQTTAPTPPATPPHGDPAILSTQGLETPLTAARASVLARLDADPTLLQQMQQEGLLPCLADDPRADDALPPLPDGLAAEGAPAYAAA